MCVKSSFPKRVKRHSKKKMGLLEKSFSHINNCICMYLCMKSYFPKLDLRNGHYHSNLDLWIGA